MNNQHLHIISFDVPSPPDYGGVVDVFYKIKSLFDAGVKIHLHCFQYGRSADATLNSFCEEVFYYPRSVMWKGLLSDKPFIVQSRDSKALLVRLKKDDYPILFEGIHCCYFLNNEVLKNRTKIVRMHNNEPQYYMHLGQRESKFFQKLYFFAEYRRLIKYEYVLQSASAILCISALEEQQYKKRFPQTKLVPAFHGNVAVTAKVGKGEYVLYHGNLEVNENKAAVKYIINEVIAGLNIPLMIAGNKPDPELVDLINKSPNITLIANPTNEKLQDLISNAHINFLPAMQSTGIKLKLLNALYQGRFCLVNDQMLAGAHLDATCIIMQSPKDAQQQIVQLMEKDFTTEDIIIRTVALSPYNDKTGALAITQLL